MEIESMDSKCVFILPYFGKFNNYFPIFLKSCEKNKDFTWFIYTDDKEEYNYPDNVKVIYTSFKEMMNRIQSKFEFSISLEKPYKLCDYRGAYGYIFNDDIKDFTHWGFCDCDIVLGRLNDFIDSEILQKFDRIYTLGHLSLFKNTEHNNMRFKCNSYYKKVFQSNYSFGFDEMVLNNIFFESKANIYYADESANISTYHTRFHLTKRDWQLKRFLTEEYIPSIFVWNDGVIQRYFYNDEDGEFSISEFPYIHLQWREMSVEKDVERSNAIQIKPNAFVSINIYEIKDCFSSLSRNRIILKGKTGLFKSTYYRIKKNLRNTLSHKWPHAIHRAKV